jgi:toxin ParE1/3/4
VWKLSSDAMDDLLGIALWGLGQFGAHQATAYDVRLTDMFDRLAASPGMGVERHGATRSARFMPCGAHNIVYQVTGQGILILRVLHHSQDWSKIL